MGYEAHSPVKQVWLPIDYNFIDDHGGDSFLEFSNAYKEKYGIDLHNIFELDKNTSKQFYIRFKNCYISAYAVGNDFGTDGEKASLVSVDAVKAYSTNEQDAENEKLLLTIAAAVGVDGYGYGFRIALPSTSSRLVNTIDDLHISLVEF
jgi:hypothetical protein